MNYKAVSVVAVLAVVGVIVTLVTWNSALVTRNSALVQELGDAYEIVQGLEDEVDALQTEVGRLKSQLDVLGKVYAPVYFLSPSGDGHEVVPELRLINTDSHAASIISELLTEMTEGPSKQSGLFPVFPPGTRLLGVEVVDGVAYVDFSSEILDQSVGSPVESAVVEAIVRTVTSVEGVTAVQILVRGETIPSLAGHVDLSRPISLVLPEGEF